MKISPLFLRLLLCLTLTLLPFGQVLANDDDKKAITPIFSVSPRIFPYSEESATLFCVTSGNVGSSEQIHPGDAFSFTLDGAAGILRYNGMTNVLGIPVVVTSATLASVNFSASLAGNKLTITYNGPAKVFPPGDSFCVKIALNAVSITRAYKIASEVKPGSSGGNGRYNSPQPQIATIAIVDFPTGPQGDPGPQGLPGSKGDKGDVGSQGVAGATGPQGPKGDTGLTGPVGPQGSKGDKGEIGATGPQGSKGDKGDTGLQGATGSQGPKGDKGDAGPQGIQGPQGSKGDTGAQGIAGQSGPKGDTGGIGPMGSPGPQGPQGLKGDTGLQGPQGLKGLNWKGAWDAAANYVVDEAISYNGSSWIAKRSNTNIPPVEGDDWTILARKGDPSPAAVTSVTASAPLTSSGGATPDISLTGIIQAINGGTGLSSPGTAGKYLRSNGTAWTSAAIPVSDVPDLSAAYVRNGTTAQAGANFNISGNGTAGGTITGNILNTTTHYNLGGARILHNTGTSNLFAGVNAGQAVTGLSTSNSFFGAEAGQSNTDGLYNSFFGTRAGQATTTGSSNAFFGTLSGEMNKTGIQNSFFGAYAGQNNTTGIVNSFFGEKSGLNNSSGGANAFFGVGAGSGNTHGNNNSFLGAQSGANNTTGSRNIFVGQLAGVTNTTENDNTSIGYFADQAANITNSTAIGNRAKVTQSNSLVLGSINGVNGATTDTNVGIGVTAPTQRLQVAGMIHSTTGGFRFPDGTTQTTAAAGAGGGVTSVTASGPLASSGGATPNISLTGVVPIANGGTGSGIQNFVDLATMQNIVGMKTFAGNVGIGTTSPGARLHTVVADPIIEAFRVQKTGGTSPGQYGFHIQPIMVGDNTDLQILPSTDAAGIALYSRNAAGTPIFGLGIDRSGNVGIGVVSPTAKLQVISTTNTAIQGYSTDGIGVTGTGENNHGVSGHSTRTSYAGVVGTHPGDGNGVSGVSTGNGTGVKGEAGAGNAIYGVTTGSGYAGYFQGKVHVNGTLSKSSGSFKIDHPLDPANKYLYHSFVESPDMMNVYNGNVLTDGGGEATITLPDYFETLNRDFRYQLTVIGQFAQAIVASEIKGNRFTIKTDKPDVKVSWQVTGVRHDPYANAHRIQIEELKPEKERGTYLFPAGYGQATAKEIESESRTAAEKLLQPAVSVKK